MFHQRPRFPSRLWAEKEGRSTCSSRPSVLTRPTPRGDLGCQHALRCSIHRRCMRSAPANSFPGARTTDRRSILKQTSVRMPRGVPSFRTWETLAMSVWLLAIWCRQRTTRNLRAKRVALGQRAPQNAAYRRLCPSSHQPRLAAPQPPTNRMNRRTTMKPIRMLLPSV
jgi:hypothetical protein